MESVIIGILLANVICTIIVAMVTVRNSIDVGAMKNSTHKIEWMPVPEPTRPGESANIQSEEEINKKLSKVVSEQEEGIDDDLNDWGV